MSTKRHFPATARNREPILEVLKGILPDSGFVLEVASGSGEHCIYFSRHFPDLIWQLSDSDPDMLTNIGSWLEDLAADGDASRILPPVLLDTRDQLWPVENADALIAINMIHISPWESCVGLMAGAKRILPPGGVLYLYGAFKKGGIHTAPSNAQFDGWLHRQNPEWGVRDLEDVIGLARDHGMIYEQDIAMPANNLSVVFRKEEA